MHPNEELVRRFYGAFAARDAETMAACYADDASFEDPAFGQLDAREARAMWRMLVGRAKDLRVELGAVQADDASGTAHWEARYDFKGHPVHNVIDARFTFAGGRFASHVDTFDWPAWARQALGLPGKLFGGTAFLKNRARATARGQLDAYLTKHG